MVAVRENNHSGKVVSAPVVNTESGRLLQDSRKPNNAPDTIPGARTGRVISQIHEEMDENLAADGRFRKRMGDS